jgi:hypothetical protein
MSLPKGQETARQGLGQQARIGSGCPAILFVVFHGCTQHCSAQQKFDILGPGVAYAELVVAKL